MISPARAMRNDKINCCFSAHGTYHNKKAPIRQASSSRPYPTSMPLRIELFFLRSISVIKQS